jgi:hypothetical protein
MHLLLKEPVHSRAIAGLDGHSDGKPLTDEAAPFKAAATKPAEPATPVAS